MDPDRAEPYVELGKLYLKTAGREDDGLKELEAAAALDCMDVKVPKLLVEKYAAKQRWQKVAEVAPLAIYTDPFDVMVHLRFARALSEIGRGKEALGEVAAGLECGVTEEQKAELKGIEERAKRGK